MLQTVRSILHALAGSTECGLFKIATKSKKNYIESRYLKNYDTYRIAIQSELPPRYRDNIESAGPW